jgi:hypothetical protein
MEDRLLRAAKIIALIIISAFFVEAEILLPKLVRYAQNIDASMIKIHHSISSSANEGL